MSTQNKIEDLFTLEQREAASRGRTNLNQATGQEVILGALVKLYEEGYSGLTESAESVAVRALENLYRRTQQGELIDVKT